MKNWLKDRFDRIRGTGVHAPTVPPMDGTLRPNTLLERAAAVHEVPEPDNLVSCSGRLLFSSGSALLAYDPATGRADHLEHYASAITALAVDGATTVVALEDGSIHILAEGRKSRQMPIADQRGTHCVTDLAFSAPGTLVLCLGSSRHGTDRWKHDLMERGTSGRVLEVDLATGNSRELAGDLAYPYGIAPTPSGLVVAEAWRHRLVSLTGTGPRTVLANLPAYPSRLRPSAAGGYWLTLFAPRSQLIELVLRHRAYRDRMMRDIEPEYWVAPALAPARSFKEPLQGGAIRTHGIVKPWAPTRSYGLVVRLDETFTPVASYHSRADGTRHGIVSVAEIESEVYVASKGGNVLLRLPAEGRALGEES